MVARRSSIENLTSTPFSIRDSGSAFINQYERSESSSSSSDSSWASTDSDFVALAFAPFCTGYFRGLPTGRFPSRGVAGLGGVTIRYSILASNSDIARIEYIIRTFLRRVFARPSTTPLRSWRRLGGGAFRVLARTTSLSLFSGHLWGSLHASPMLVSAINGRN